ARPKDPIRERRALDLPFLLRLRPVVRHELLRLLARAEGAHMHEAPNADSVCGSEEIARALDHDPLELLAPALPDPDEMNHRVDACDGTAQALRVRDVALDELAAPGRELRSPA